MKKLTPFENYLLTQGLEKIRAEWVEELEAAEQNGNRPIYTPAWVEMMTKETKEKIDALTSKPRK
jgi:hypothetical protein